MEVIFHCPYLVHAEIADMDDIVVESEDDVIAHSARRPSMAAESTRSSKSATDHFRPVLESISPSVTKHSSIPDSIESQKQAKHKSLTLQSPIRTSSKPASTVKSPDTSEPKSFQSIVANLLADDLVHVIWIEDFKQAHTIPRKILSFVSARTTKPIVPSTSVFLFVHPLPHTESLYWIKLLTCTSLTSVPSIPDNVVY
jgi:hypothetical protein